MEDLLRDILKELQSINLINEEILFRLPGAGPSFNIDNIYERIGELATDFTGPAGYNLTDIHARLEAIELIIDLK